MFIKYKSLDPINLANTDYINFKLIDSCGIINFRFKYEFHQWKFTDSEEGQKVYNTIVKNYFTEIKID